MELPLPAAWFSFDLAKDEVDRVAVGVESAQVAAFRLKLVEEAGEEVGFSNATKKNIEFICIDLIFLKKINYNKNELNLRYKIPEKTVLYHGY